MRSVRAALLGFPNSGKSTLLNKMAGRKISIATHKAQTTRAPILGVLEHDGRRVIVSDTPGINSPRRQIRIQRRARGRHGLGFGRASCRHRRGAEKRPRRQAFGRGASRGVSARSDRSE